jgi:hypothetical protein
VLAGLSLLQKLEIGPQDLRLEPEHLRQIFATSSQLRSLTINFTQLRQQEVDVILAHGTQLTSLTIAGLCPTEDRSQSACTWKELIIREESPQPLLLANMPLHSLDRLCIGRAFSLPAQRPVLKVPIVWHQHPEQLLQVANLLCRALTNLERCPAWQQSGPCVELYLTDLYARHSMSAAQLNRLFGALAGLVSKGLHLSIYASKLVMDGVAVQELSTAVGNRLIGLTLVACQLRAKFWPAMWAQLPRLQQLSLDGEDVSARLTARTLVSYCKAATHPLQLELSQDWCSKLGGVDKLQQQLQQSGVTQVTVVLLQD